MINFMKYESIYHFFLYIKFHKQLPKKNRTLTGLMYHIRSSDILSDPLRITVTDKEYAKKFIIKLVIHMLFRQLKFYTQ